MFRKFAISIAAAAAIGAAAFTPTAASAHGWGWHHHHHWFHGFYGPGYIVGGDCYFVDRVVYTPFGKRIRRVEVCD